jgi:hypothetical protein
VPASAVHVEDEPRWHESEADSGNTARRGFCAACGSPLFADSSASRGVALSIKAASLDDPGWFRPQADPWMRTAQPWACTDAALPKSDTHPPHT